MNSICTMSLTRNVSELNLPAPPPSPIPTGRGSRSAANKILADYLEMSLHVPDLALPEPHIPLGKHRNISMEINYLLLKSRDSAVKNQLLKAVKECGIFKVVDHGIADEELRLLVKEADRICCALELTSLGFGRHYQQEIVWVLSGTERMELEQEFVGAERFRHFSESMEKFASKLDAIAQELYNVLAENTGKKQFGRTIQGKESIFSLYKFNSKNDTELNPPMPVDEKNSKASDHTLCFHLPTTLSRFFVKLERDLCCFDAGSDTIVVTIGKRLQEWSQGDLKGVLEVTYEPYIQDNQPSSFLIELKCLSFNSDLGVKRDHDTISIRDQILIGVVLYLLYNIYLFLLP